MRSQEIAVMKRRVAKRDKRQIQAIWFGLCFGIGAQSLSVVLGFIASWERGLKSIGMGMLGMLVWIPVILYMRKTTILSNASMMVSTLLMIMGKRDDDGPITDDESDSLFVRLVIFRFGILAWGTPEGKWKDGCDPYHSHPDDRRRRLLELLTMAAWRDLPGMPYQVRLDMIALAQLCIAAEVVQSRSMTGRIRNGLLRIFVRREPAAPPRHIIRIEDDPQ